MRRWVLASVLAASLVAQSATATYSVLLTNIETREIGGATTSCVGDFDLSAIFGYARNEDRAVAFFTQALYSEFNHDQALTWLSDGHDVAEVLARLTDPAFDDYSSERQYHFLPSDADGATWTGAKALAYAGGRFGSVGPWRYTLAGNILTSERVLTMAEESLQTSEGPLEERLLAALEAGARYDEGDSRCTPLPGDSAYMEVRDANGVSRLRHGVVDTKPDNPLDLLRRVALPANESDSQSPVSSSSPGVSPTTDTITPDTASSSQNPSSTTANERSTTTSCLVSRSPGRGFLLACFVLAGLGLRRGGHRRVTATRRK